MAHVDLALDAERIIARGGRKETGLADDEIAELSERVGYGILVAGENAETVQAEVASPASVLREVLLMSTDGARLMDREVSPVALAGGAIRLEVGAAVERIGGHAVGQKGIDVDEDVVGVIGEELRGLITIGFKGVTELDKRRAGNALLNRRGDVAAAAEVVAAPAGGVRVPR